MSAGDGGESAVQPEGWEQEVLFRHRWGRYGDEVASGEVARLREFWRAAQPLSEPRKAIVEQIRALEICNWNLEESILALCAAIGRREPTELAIGHLASISEGRWKEVWAYYLTLRNWLPREAENSGYEPLLRVCDPDNTVRNHILSLLGERNELKQLYVERSCLTLEFWLSGIFPPSSAQMKAHGAAVSAVEEEIRRRDPEGQILAAMKAEGDGKLQPCHHKAFRRWDIILSSIGAGRWRAAMPMRGTDGLERAATLEKYLLPIEAWIEGRGTERDGISERIHILLGERDEAKLFLASLLVSLLRAQGIAARRRAESRAQTT